MPARMGTEHEQAKTEKAQSAEGSGDYFWWLNSMKRYFLHQVV